MNGAYTRALARKGPLTAPTFATGFDISSRSDDNAYIVDIHFRQESVAYLKLEELVSSALLRACPASGKTAFVGRNFDPGERRHAPCREPLDEMSSFHSFLLTPKPNPDEITPLPSFEGTPEPPASPTADRPQSAWSHR